MIDTKALRQKVLDLAIRGKLVPQDPNDEPASVLLDRIRAQKQQMVKDGKLKAKDIKNDTVIFKDEDNLHYEKFADGSVKCIEDEIPFDLPEGWSWCRVHTVASVKGGKRIPKGYSVIDMPTNHAYIRITDMKNQTVLVDDLKYITDDVFSQISAYTISKDDLYVTIAGTIGSVGEIPDILDGMNLTENAVKISNISINKKYLCYVLSSEFVQKQFRYQTHQVTMAKLALERILDTLIPVSPLKEQKQITERIQEANEQIEHLNESTIQIGRLINKAKSKILDLAIRGQLVPQNPTDEPASVLLDRIRAEKEELIKQGKIKRDKKESVIFKGEDNSYYLSTGGQVESIEEWNLDMIPKSWTLCCLGEVCDYGNCINVETGAINDTDWILDLEDIEKDSGRVLKKVMKKDRNANSTKHRFHKGQVLYSKLRPYLNKVVLADDDGYCTSEILPLEFHKIIVPEYARYYMMSPTFLAYADRCSYGVKMPRLGTPDGKKAVFVVPPVDEQKRIAEAIESAFEQLNSIGATLE